MPFSLHLYIFEESIAPISREILFILHYILSLLWSIIHFSAQHLLSQHGEDRKFYTYIDILCGHVYISNTDLSTWNLLAFCKYFTKNFKKTV